MSRNLAASVRARLKRHADATGQDFNLTLTHYGLERLLYRLSVSEHVTNYPVLLKEFPAPQLRAYPKYTVIAEKFHAVCLLGLTNTRLKDYFDLWVLLHDATLDHSEIHRAIGATLTRRKMPMPSTVPVGFTAIFAADASKQTQWKAFLKKNQLDAILLTDVVTLLRDKFHAIGII